jgi:hypothetical protein
MNALTGRRVSYNAQVWLRKIEAEKGDDGDDAGEPEAPPALPAPEPVVPVSRIQLAYVAVGGGCLVLLLIVYAVRRLRAPPPAEPRRSMRQAVAMSVSYRFLGHGEGFEGGQKRKSKATNVSSSGMRLRIEVPQTSWIADLKSKKILLGLEIDVPGQRAPLVAHATVAWVKPVSGRTYEAGVEYKEITQRDAERLKKYLLKRSMG